MTMLWRTCTCWSWQLSSYEHLPFTRPSFLSATASPLLAVQVCAFPVVIFTWTSTFLVLLFPVAFIDHTQSLCNMSPATPSDCRTQWSSHFVSRLTLIVHVPTPCSTVPSFPLQDVANARLLCLCLFWLVCLGFITVRFLKPNVTCPWSVVACTVSVNPWPCTVICCGHTSPRFWGTWLDLARIIFTTVHVDYPHCVPWSRYDVRGQRVTQ